MTKEMLERLGYRVVAATQGFNALKLFREDPSRFDLVITDQTMPDITGLELAAELMRVRKEIPVILSTGYSETVPPETAKEIGIRRYLMKPISKREIAAALREVLRGEG